MPPTLNKNAARFVKRARPAKIAASLRISAVTSRRAVPAMDKSVEAKMAHTRLASLYESVVAGGTDISARDHHWRSASLDRYSQD